MGTRPRSARAVDQSRFAFVLVAAPPLVSALTGNIHRLGRRRDCPASGDTTPQPEPAFRGEGSVTVHHGLLGSCDAFDSSTLAQAATYSADVNNVPGHNT